MLAGLGFGRAAEIEINLATSIEPHNRTITNVNHYLSETDKTPHSVPLFFDGETIQGDVNIQLRKQKLEHKGIQIEVIGVIELFGDKSNQYEFLSDASLLAGPEVLTRSTKYPFKFDRVNKPHESYTGINVKCRYFLRVRVVKMLADIVKELDFAVHTISTYSDLTDKPLKMEVGIDQCLHIEFEYKKSRYHLEDCIVGRIYFMVVRLKIKHMEICIIRKESAGFGQNQYNEPEVMAKYDIMDGPPNKGEDIPLRLYLKPYAKAGKLTPTMKDVAKRFSVRYFLHLKLIDEDERTYYKQQEITLWRKPDVSMGLNVHMFKNDETRGVNGETEDAEVDDYDGEEAAL
jgi:vacuolar protein sorting-associated protein 26